MKPKVLIKIASRERPEPLGQIIGRINDFTSDETETRILISADREDSSMQFQKIGTMIKSSRVPIRIIYNRPPQNKIIATNANIAEIEGDFAFDLLINLADDMIPIVKGFDSIMANDVFGAFPDGDGTVWYGDGIQDAICTMCVMGKKYYDRDRIIYHEAFFSLFADNAYTDLAIFRQRIRFRRDFCPVKHGWVWFTGKDDLHIRNTSPAVLSRDREVYRQMAIAGFPEKWNVNWRPVPHPN